MIVALEQLSKQLQVEGILSKSLLLKMAAHLYLNFYPMVRGDEAEIVVY